jgi:hypothetical protein
VDTTNERDQRIAAVVGPDPEQAFARWLEHLRTECDLPCEVTGRVDFDWEEPYLLGQHSKAEYRKLRKTRPSYQDVYVLKSIEDLAAPDWVDDPEELGAIVQRKSDGRGFLLALGILQTVENGTTNHELLDDYAYWLTKHRGGPQGA